LATIPGGFSIIEAFKTALKSSSTVGLTAALSFPEAFIPKASHIDDKLRRDEWRPQMAAVPRRLKRIEVCCPEYETTATISINDAHSSGTDYLEVDYRSPDHSHFRIAIPDDWTDQDLLELIFLPPRDPGPQNWPAWEIPAYRFVSYKLFRFWKGEEKPDN
jgi:hypothetical protein